MSETSEYRVVTASTGQIETELAGAAVKSWRPILMSSVLTSKGIMVTVILEHNAKADRLLGYRGGKPTSVKRKQKTFFAQLT